MAINEDYILNFIGYFRGMIADIESVAPLLFRKILYATVLDPLSRAAFGKDDDHHKRIVRLLDELTDWQERDRVSLPQLVLALEENNLRQGRLYSKAKALLAQWPPGHVLRLNQSPLKNDFSVFAGLVEARILSSKRYAELFYTYRNNLVHEFREPAYGIEMPSDKDQPYYSSMIDNPWQLVFPIGFFARIASEALNGLEKYLFRMDIDPYSQFEFGSLWRAK